MEKMKIFWKNGFYIDGVSALPEGSVEISEDYYQELLAAQARGAAIETGENGLPIVVPPSLAEKKADAENTLWQNYKTFQETYVDAEDLTLAVICASKGSAKGMAVQMWVMELWAQYYTVKDQIAAASTEEELSSIDLTADSFGTPPYTIRELNEEAAAALATMNETSGGEE